MIPGFMLYTIHIYIGAQHTIDCLIVARMIEQMNNVCDENEM